MPVVDRWVAAQARDKHLALVPLTTSMALVGDPQPSLKGGKFKKPTLVMLPRCSIDSRNMQRASGCEEAHGQRREELLLRRLGQGRSARADQPRGAARQVKRTVVAHGRRRTPTVADGRRGDGPASAKLALEMPSLWTAAEVPEVRLACPQGLEERADAFFTSPQPLRRSRCALIRAEDRAHSVRLIPRAHWSHL